MPPSPTAVFRRPGFPLMYAALSTSALGDSVLLLVLGVWAKTLTGQNGSVGIVYLCMLVPALVAPFLGAWADGFRRKPLLIWTNVASALAVLPLTVVDDASDIWILYGVAVLYGLSFVIVPAGVNGLLKELLDDEALVDANSALATTKEAFRLFAPLAGAAMFAAWGGWTVAVVDAVSFLVAAVLIARIRVDEAAPQRHTAGLVDAMTSGVRLLVADRVLKHVLVGLGLTLLVVGFTESGIYAVLDAFGKPATYVAIVVMVQGIGAVLGGLASSWSVRHLGEVSTIVVSCVILATSMAVVALAGTIPVLLAASAVFGFGLPLMFVAYTTLIQRRTEQAVMARVTMAAEVVMSVPQAVSLAVGAVVVSLVPYRWAFGVITVVTLLGAAHVLWWLRDQLRPGTTTSTTSTTPPSTTPESTTPESTAPGGLAPVSTDGAPELPIDEDAALLTDLTDQLPGAAGTSAAGGVLLLGADQVERHHGPDHGDPQGDRHP
ncbi:MFS transporter [Arsenicicoccus sp. UBA7492]|uniref:MFS transporter n=1 Tax=Arsenicicoccus sp. UBA7492 TaxID=1946057 RepID=UPI00257DE939|nr:MFS transporter [Arsenicicoccus sp. UBA7492]